MARKTTVGPTDRELDILNVLWQQGRATVREVHEQLALSAPVSFTSVQTMLQIMYDKGLVERELVARSYTYWARHSQADTQGTLLSSLLERAFGGSAKALVTRALAAAKATPQELDEIQALIDKAREANDD